MQENGFRKIVREELVLWMENNRQRFDILISRIMEMLAPVVAEELEHGLLVRIGKIEPDEREQAKMLLEQARAFVTRYGLQKATGIEQFDLMLKDIDAAISRLSLSRPIPPPGS